MLDRYPLYPCLVDAEDRVISFPPVTNSGVTRYTIWRVISFPPVTNSGVTRYTGLYHFPLSLIVELPGIKGYIISPCH